MRVPVGALWAPRAAVWPRRGLGADLNRYQPILFRWILLAGGGFLMLLWVLCVCWLAAEMIAWWTEFGVHPLAAESGRLAQWPPWLAAPLTR